MNAPPGGYAFPTRVWSNVSVDPQAPIIAEGFQPGMTLRDYFAGQALAAVNLEDFTAEAIATICYDVADAMIAERDK